MLDTIRCVDRGKGWSGEGLWLGGGICKGKSNLSRFYKDINICRKQPKIFIPDLTIIIFKHRSGYCQLWTTPRQKKNVLLFVFFIQCKGSSIFHLQHTSTVADMKLDLSDHCTMSLSLSNRRSSLHCNHLMLNHTVLVHAPKVSMGGWVSSINGFVQQSIALINIPCKLQTI